ncbi:hypothetical protein [Sorangium sp. So ce1099]|uniref:hypothetical protein n=1 Tax=Sorangium sp. So ce1099 TaxID=3133331 RepID=UPI003F5DC5E6
MSLNVEMSPRIFSKLNIEMFPVGPSRLNAEMSPDLPRRHQLVALRKRASSPDKALPCIMMK